jgi:hypothetical protein
MVPFIHSTLYACVGGVLVAAFAVVRLGHRILGLLRDYREFRAGR